MLLLRAFQKHSPLMLIFLWSQSALLKERLLVNSTRHHSKCKIWLAGPGELRVKTETFLRYVSLLTGTEVKGESELDHASLSEILSNESRVIDCSQFNELLLLVHK